jgi:hypothetical protein
LSQLTQRRQAVFVEVLPSSARTPQSLGHQSAQKPSGSMGSYGFCPTNTSHLASFDETSRTERSLSQSAHRCTFRGTSALSKFVNLRLSLLQSEPHVHLAVHIVIAGVRCSCACSRLPVATISMCGEGVVQPGRGRLVDGRYRRGEGLRRRRARQRSRLCDNRSRTGVEAVLEPAPVDAREVLSVLRGSQVLVHGEAAHGLRVVHVLDGRPAEP